MNESASFRRDVHASFQLPRIPWGSSSATPRYRRLNAEVAITRAWGDPPWLTRDNLITLEKFYAVDLLLYLIVRFDF
jgi:hypothetical protein